MYKAAALEKAEENVLALAAVFPALAPHLISPPRIFIRAASPSVVPSGPHTANVCMLLSYNNKTKTASGSTEEEGKNYIHKKATG